MRNQFRDLCTKLTHDFLDRNGQFLLKDRRVLLAPSHIFHFHSAMPFHPRRAASTRAEGEVAPFLWAGNPSKLVKAVCQVMINDFQDEVQGGLKLIWTDVTKHRASSTKVIDHILVCLDSFENTMPSAVVGEEIAQLDNGVIVSAASVTHNKSSVCQSRWATDITQTKWQ